MTRASRRTPGRRTPRRWRSAAVLTAAVVALAGCTGSSTGGGQGGGEAGYVSADYSVRLLGPSDREPAPELTGATIDGEQVTADQLEGKVLVVNVFASWCPPCRSESPALERVWQATRSLDVQFLGLNTKDDLAAARAFVDRYQLSYPSLDGNNGRLLLGFRDSMPSEAIPTTWIIDRQGRVAARILNEVDEGILQGLVEDIAAEGTVAEGPA